jgi:heat-inducible transcriptional repressor|nr:heat-inducible transcriptional repressor HrcA [Candidatus Krumholzibacteria bacterium]
MSRIDERSRDILDAVVRLNIETGGPVSSGLVERSLQREISSATIRSVMKRLEELGYLEQPHTSAGRLPTDAGYRVFVDRFQGDYALTRWTGPDPMEKMVDVGFPVAAAGPDGVRSMARLLSDLTDYISIILAPSLDTVKAVRVDLYPRTLQRVLMVVLLENAQVRTGLIELPEEYAHPVVEQAAQLLTRRISGLSVQEIRRGDLESPDLMPSPATRCAAAVARKSQAMFAETAHSEIQLEGVGKVLDEPEFRDPEPLKALLRFIESPRTIRESLGSLDQHAQGGVGVWIGQENPVGQLRSFSVLTGRFTLEGRSGVLAVLGPRRMWYQRAFRGIEVLRTALNPKT